MHCGTSGRTPPRRPALVGRLTCLVLLLLLALPVSAGPVSAQPCAPKRSAPASAPARGMRTLAARVSDAGPKECQPSGPFEKRGNADPISFAFFIGIIVAVLLVPVALGRREDLPPE